MCSLKDIPIELLYIPLGCDCVSSEFCPGSWSIERKWPSSRWTRVPVSPCTPAPSRSHSPRAACMKSSCPALLVEVSSFKLQIILPSIDWSRNKGQWIVNVLKASAGVMMTLILSNIAELYLFFFHWDTYSILTNIACIRSDHRWNNAVVSARNVLAIQWLYPVSLRSSQWLGQPARLYHLLLLAQPFPTLLWALLSSRPRTGLTPPFLAASLKAAAAGWKPYERNSPYDTN